MAEKIGNDKELEQAKRFLESQGVDVKKLEEERKAMKERVKTLDRHVRLAPSVTIHGPSFRYVTAGHIAHRDETVYPG